MAYTTNSGRVRVDFFKPSGKWYGTASVDMSAFYDGGPGDLIHEQFLRACRAEQANPKGEWGHTFTPDSWLEGGGAIVCLKPYHAHEHPLMLMGLTWTMRGPTGEP